MHLAYSLGTLGPQTSAAADQLALIQEAEQLGYESAWASEGYGIEPATTLAWLAAGTERIGLGAGVLQVSGRTPIASAMAAVTIDRLSGGRFHLGLGTSGPQVAEGWHGRRFDRPLAHLRDYTTIVRLALEGHPVHHEGETITLPLPDSSGKDLTMAIEPVRKPLPIHLAAMGPRAIALAGELADGWLPIHFPPGHLAEGLAHLKSGAAAAGRDASTIQVSPMVLALVDDDPDVARDMIRPMLALYIGGMGSRRVNFYNRLIGRLGFGAAAERVQDAYLSGDVGGAVEELPDELVDAVTVCGTPEDVRDRLDAYRAAGATRLIMGTTAQSLSDRIDQLRWIAEIADL